MQSRQYITCRGAAERAGVAASTITRAIRRGELSVHRTRDDHPLLLVAEVDRWRRQERRPGPKPRKSDAQAGSARDA